MILLRDPPEMEKQPLVSIVTPSFNSARFIDQTIESVLAQDYSNIEYTVVDGGSTDGTVAILERYRGRLHFTTEPDRGTADAVNRGFLRSRGAIFAWLSADDTYLPGAVSAAVRRFLAEQDAAIVYGGGYWMDEHGAILRHYPTVAPYDPTMFARECCVCQPACFIRREAFEKSGMLNETLRSAFDYDLWIRLSRRDRFVAVPEFLAMSRMHNANKSLGEQRVMFEESIQLLREHYGYVPLNWIYGYLMFLLDRRDQFFQPLRQSPLIYLISLPAGFYYNHRRPSRYLREWTSRLVATAGQWTLHPR